MSSQTQQAGETSSAATAGQDLTTELKVICTLWILGAILAGVGFIALRSVFAGLA